ncbi:cholinesterase isoform X1 [Hetaerina americana]|uniref:cholinesterase isoform X1 n=1 Tax=Hetaerina americana TaxID=62018 RepID=UPI003A7F153B
MASLVWRKKRWRDSQLIWLLLAWNVWIVVAQTNYRDGTGSRDYAREGVYNPDGSYGQGGYPAYGPQWPGQQWQQDWQSQRKQQNYGAFDDRFKYQPMTTELPLPGILAGWQPELQGRKRPDSLNLDINVLVSTNYGQVQGFKVYLYDHPDPSVGFRTAHSPVDRVQGVALAFLGIPYAMPPVAEGRFKPPRAHRGWRFLQAVDFGPACPQPVRYTGATRGVPRVDEDCLYLNIFTPPRSTSVPVKFPVMVYIHGGEFLHGASNLFPGHMLAAFYDVIVVTINYRLGALGFLSTADENSPGNYGILDQSMALNWVSDNIEYFNGDKNLITLFGPGAGAASAGLLMVAPKTHHLVARVIAQSGSPVADWALILDKYRAQNTSIVFGNLLGCSTESSWKLVNCLRQGRNFYEIGNTEFVPQVGTFPWGPVLDVNFTHPPDGWYEGWRYDDWKFITDTPENLIKSGAFRPNLAYMSGVTHDEASYMLFNNESLAPRYDINEAFFDNKVKEFVLRYNYTLNPDGIYNAIKYMYTHWPDPQNTTLIREEYINMLSDFFFRAPNDKVAKLLVEKNVPVYLYVLNTTIEAHRLPFWRRVPHDIEHHLLTGSPFMDPEFFPKRSRLDKHLWTDNDRNMSHFFMKAFSNFAREGNPTSTQILGIHFDVARPGSLNYLNINTTFNSSVMMNYRQTECAFWTEYLPTVIGILVPTYPPVTEYWWEPNEPLQIAFWSVSGACLVLIVVVVVCCILWRNAKRQSDRYYSGQLGIDQDDGDGSTLDNHAYEYRDAMSPPLHLSNPPKGRSATPPPVSAHPGGGKEAPGRRSASNPSLKTGSALSLKDSAYNGNRGGNGKVSGRPQPIPRSSVPQTEV